MKSVLGEFLVLRVDIFSEEIHGESGKISRANVSRESTCSKIENSLQNDDQRPQFKHEEYSVDRDQHDQVKIQETLKVEGYKKY